MKRFIIIATLALAACTPGSTPAIAVASLGIAGAGLSAYCASQGAGCTPAILAYSSLIVTEASKDATILESGQTTTAEITQIITTLNADIDQGRALVGLTPAQQNQVSAIITAAQSVVTLVQALVPASAGPGTTVKVPKLTPADTAKLAKMRAKVAGAKK